MISDVCDKIRLLRISHNLTQEEIAEQLKLSTSGYAKIERGETELSISRLEKIAKVFNISVIDLLTFKQQIENKIIHFNDQSKSQNSCIYLGNTNSSHEIFSLNNKTEKLNHEIEKLKIIVESQSKEIELLKTLLNIQRLTEK